MDGNIERPELGGCGPGLPWMIELLTVYTGDHMREWDCGRGRDQRSVTQAVEVLYSRHRMIDK